MRTLKLKIEYDGTNYHGWQSQPNGLTIQDILTKAISEFTNERITLIGASRTDSGVHALGQTAHFQTVSTIPIAGFLHGLNNKIPRDIRIARAEDVDPTFHSRYDTLWKHYSYYIRNDATTDAFFDRYYARIIQPLDTNRMKDALAIIQQCTDFKSFVSSDPDTHNTCVTIDDIRLTAPDETTDRRPPIFGKDIPLIRVDFFGRAFLKHMIRNIMGTVIEIGLGKIDISKLRSIIDSRDRTKAGIKARACGLFLVHIEY